MFGLKRTSQMITIIQTIAVQLRPVRKLILAKSNVAGKVFMPLDHLDSVTKDVCTKYGYGGEKRA